MISLKKISMFMAFFVLIFAGMNLAQNEEWVARYNGAGNGSDTSYRMGIDAGGNIYVAGITDNGTNRDIVVVQYNSDGVQQWVQTYNGTGNGNDSVSGFKVDSSGNSYVTGISTTTLGAEWTTIKYDSAGVQQWITFHEGNGREVWLDSSGNVYVVGSVAGENYVTVKYDGSGNMIWEAVYQEPQMYYTSAENGITDPMGNVYVTGLSRSDWLTVKYNSSGVEQWAVRMNSSIFWDWADEIALDSAGNIYVSGTYGENENGLDSYAVVKYDSNGTELWLRTYKSGTTTYNHSSCMAVDSAGNVYLSGVIFDANYTNADCTTLKYDTNGNLLWDKTYNGPGNGYDAASNIILDSNGSIYIVGTTFGTDYDILTLKYDGNGNLQWTESYNGPGNGEDRGYGIKLDSAGNVYVSGPSEGDGTDDDICTIKYSENTPLSKAQEIKDLIAGLPDSAFSKNAAKQKTNLLKWVDKIILNIDLERYLRAIKILQKIGKKMDGYLGSNPKNDWIIDQSAQETIYPLVQELIENLRQL